MFDFDEWEYCDLVTYRTLGQDGVVLKSAFVKFPDGPTQHKMRNRTYALAKLTAMGWQVILVTSSNHPDGTVQIKFHLKRLMRDKK